ncbi:MULTISPECIES: hypothetical protein [Burkholderia]|uniref:hypothetical protein n=1 Tax=Burkholderia TaxID=32008 RepID=UPI0007180AC8|nr:MULTISPECIES: hypothetical protein [Burkholderia]KWK81861.1 hypothetical protein WM15_20855 [Burkholderia ubonensis]
MPTLTERISRAELIARFVELEIVEDGARYIVGAGDRRAGLRGMLIAVIRFRHDGGYEVVLQLDNGKLDSFSFMQLLPELPH